MDPDVLRKNCQLKKLRRETIPSPKANGERGGHLTCQGIIEDDNRIRGFQSQREHFRFTRSKIHDQREDGGAGWRAYCDPLEHCRIRQAHPSGPDRPRVRAQQRAER